MNKPVFRSLPFLGTGFCSLPFKGRARVGIDSLRMPRTVLRDQPPPTPTPALPLRGREFSRYQPPPTPTLAPVLAARGRRPSARPMARRRHWSRGPQPLRGREFYSLPLKGRGPYPFATPSQG
jgi:hypothetical protein